MTMVVVVAVFPSVSTTSTILDSTVGPGLVTVVVVSFLCGAAADASIAGGKAKEGGKDAGEERKGEAAHDHGSRRKRKAGLEWVRRIWSSYPRTNHQ